MVVRRSDRVYSVAGPGTFSDREALSLLLIQVRLRVFSCRTFTL